MCAFVFVKRLCAFVFVNRLCAFLFVKRLCAFLFVNYAIMESSTGWHFELCVRLTLYWWSACQEA